MPRHRLGLHQPAAILPEDDVIIISDDDEDEHTVPVTGAQVTSTSVELQEHAIEVDDEEAIRRRILDELEVVPGDMKANKEVVKKLKEEAAEILRYIETSECREYLRSVAWGKTRSDRHKEFQECGMLLSGLGPFTLFEEMKCRLLKIIDEHCGACVDMNDPTYQWSVMLPEAIIYGAQKILKCTKVVAVTYFEETSKFIAEQ